MIVNKCFFIQLGKTSRLRKKARKIFSHVFLSVLLAHSRHVENGYIEKGILAENKSFFNKSQSITWRISFALCIV